MINQLKICALLAVIAAAPRAGANTDGVSRTLARVRSAEISDVKYQLHFFVPSVQQEPVGVDATISFTYSGTGPVVFDFEGSVGKARANGHTWTPTVENEHITVPAAFLRKGSNSVEFLNCHSSDKALNRRADHLYTLFVPANARSAFPCFDQPDLKARFDLTLTLPDGWTALSAGPLTDSRKDGRHTVLTFEQSDLLPTYLFSFAAGKFAKADTTINGRRLELFHLETDPQKTAQIPEIFRLSAHALKWMEDCTGVPYPFRKVALVALPGYQFGGMEHPGAIQYKSNTIFLEPAHTPAEVQRRAELLAHETAHMWFGDLVTMQWFNDVWTKEVFANLMASKATASMFPDQDTDLTFLRSIQTKAMATDVTPGTHAIEQDLDNLNTAGLLYGNIIYQKAPVMMRKLEQRMGSERFREGLGEYLRTYSYGNATWDDLISILDRHAPDAGLPRFSYVWVKEAGLPDIYCVATNGMLRVEQRDPLERGLLWPQEFSVGAVMADGAIHEIPVTLDSAQFTTQLPEGTTAIIPNINGEGYGRFRLSDGQLNAIRGAWPSLSPLRRQAALMHLYDAALQGQIRYADLAPELLERLAAEQNEQIAATICAQLSGLLRLIAPSQLEPIETRARHLADTTPSPAVHLALTRTLSMHGQHTDYSDVWTSESDSLLSPKDYMQIAFHLALRHPEQATSILATQRQRLEAKSPALIEEFDYVSRGALPGAEAATEAFKSLLDASNRRTEPWATSLLALLADESRGAYTLGFIAPALSAMEDVRRNGAIFFPANWAAALLAGYRSPEAGALLREWLEANPDYRPALVRKIKESGAHLLR